MILRQGIGLALGLGGVVLLTRLIGPGNYGLYAGALALVSFASGVGRLGTEVYLVRREQRPDRVTYSQAVTLLLLSGFALTGLCLLALPLLAEWFADARFLPPLRVMILAIPLTLVCMPAFAALERDLDFRKVAILELVGQAIFYLFALPLAALGYGVWAPVTAYWVWQSWLVLGGYSMARLRPRLVWSPALIRDMLSYGISYSASTWLWSLRSLVNPLVVGRYLGAESVGYVSLAIRLVDVLSFVRDATWRLSIAALAKVQGDYPRLRRVMEEAMTLQVLGVAPVLGVGAAVLGFLPLLLGRQWEPVTTVFSFIAVGSLVNAVFNMHSSALYVLRRNRDVAAFHLAHVVLFGGSAIALVPAMGLIGYGLAEVVALGGYFVIHRRVTRLFPLSYRATLPWLLGLTPPIFAVLLPLPWALLLAVPAVALPLARGPRRVLRQCVGQLLS